MKNKKKSPEREKYEAEIEEIKKQAEADGSIETRKRLARVYDSLAFACKEEKDYDRALECHLQSYKICRDLFEGDQTAENEEAFSSSCGNVGAICRDIGNAEKANEFYEEAIAHGLKAAEKLRTPKSYNSLALLYFEAGLLDRRKPDRELLKKAYDIWEILAKEHPDNQAYRSLKSSVAIVLNEKYKKRRGLAGLFLRKRR
jgi:tetratricopeptide (TPR) repeat protein